MNKILIFIGVTCGAILELHSQGYIVPNGVTYLGFNGLGYETHVLQNPTNSDYTGFLLVPQGGNAFSFDPFLDEGVRTFLVALNNPISLQPISAGSYTELTNPNNYMFNDGVPFYLGFYTGPRWTQLPPTNPITYDDPLFGWAKLVNNQGVIQLLDSALEYGGGGIYAGTQNIIPIPEPSVLGLFSLAALLFVRRRFSERP